MYTKAITLPNTLTYLHINGATTESFIWPSSLHTLVLGRTLKPLQSLPEGLKVLKIDKDCNNLPSSLPSSLTEISGGDGLTLSCNYHPLLPPHLQRLNLHYDICCTAHPKGHTFPPSLTYIKSLTTTERENIPKKIVVDNIQRGSGKSEIDMLLDSLSYPISITRPVSQARYQDLCDIEQL